MTDALPSRPGLFWPVPIPTGPEPLSRAIWQIQVLEPGSISHVLVTIEHVGFGIVPMLRGHRLRPCGQWLLGVAACRI